MNEKNKLTIYLLKDGLKNEQIIKDYYSFQIDGQNKKLEIAQNKTIYYSQSYEKKPSWLSDFFDDNINIEGLHTSNSKLVLVVEVEYKTKKVKFAITMGYGKNLLIEGAIVDNFGLKFVLNNAKSNSIRKIDKINIVGNQKSSIEQLPIQGKINEFDYDIDSDLINGLTATANEDIWFEGIISGKDMLSISANVNVNNIDKFLVHCYARYDCNDYKKDFDWIDNISHIRDKELIRELDTQLIKSLQEDNKSFWVAVPEVIDWAGIVGFKIAGCKNINDDVFISDVLSSFKKPLTSTEQLKNKLIYCVDTKTNSSFKHWNAYKCLFGELSLNNKIYCINNGKWYSICKNFKEEIENDYNNTRTSNIDFINYTANHHSENEYSKDFTNQNKSNYTCLDTKNIMYGGGRNRIEVCDILSKNKELIHIKPYSGSSTLSHLFNQGTVSLELLLEDREFLNNANKKIEEVSGNTEFDISTTDRGKLKVIYGIITKDSNLLPHIPFFSKVAFKYAKRRIQAMGCSVEIKSITKIV